MNLVDALLRRYEQVVSGPWDDGLAGQQKVWFAVYEPEQERRLRLRVLEFEQLTRQAGHEWSLIDVTDSFGRWLEGEEYRDAYFEDPEILADRMDDFAQFVADEVTARLDAAGDDDVVGLLGVGALFGLTSVSKLVQDVAPRIHGRLLVFFPGSYSGSTYRLLDARDGWNYLAVPITAQQEG